MGGRLLEGPTMVGRTLVWKEELGRWLKPFLDRLGHKAQRQMCPLYVWGLIGPPPQPTLPAVRHAILELIARLPPRRCPHCENGFATSSSVSKSAKVVLGPITKMRAVAASLLLDIPARNLQ